MLPPLDLFKDTMKRYGVKLSTRVVVYDSKAGAHSTRAFWMLRTFGHLGVSALNGGLAKWLREGRATEKIDAGTEADYNYTYDSSMYADYQAILDIEKHNLVAPKDTHILDARPDAVYANGHLKDGESLFFKKL